MNFLGVLGVFAVQKQEFKPQRRQGRQVEDRYVFLTMTCLVIL
jgi:hypothetical protein